MITMTEKRFFEWHEDDVSVTLRNRGGSYGCGSEVFVMQGFGDYKESQECSALKSRDYKDATDLVSQNTVRRLTPLECERLQGYPDGWTLIGDPELVEIKDYDILYDAEGNEVKKTFIGTHKEIEYFYLDNNGKKKKCSDSARYKALGNSIALPFWFNLLRKISAQYERPATLGSLSGYDEVYSGFPGCACVYCESLLCDSCLYSLQGYLAIC